MKQDKSNPNTGLRTLIDELYARVGRTTNRPAVQFAHQWADSVPTVLPNGILVVLATVTITPTTYGNLRIIGTGLVENDNPSAATFLAAVGIATVGHLPTLVYSGDPNGLVVPAEAGELVSTVNFAISYTIHDLTPGETYVVAIMGEAGGEALAVAAHGVQIDASETAT
jgi:hypothetical protein